MEAMAQERDATEPYVARIRKEFRAAGSKREAHARSRGIMLEMARDPSFLRGVISSHIASATNLNKRHFPVVAMDVESNPDFELVVNCWIPLPDRATNVSTKSIHHHGPMLLTTVTTFGPGYEHWMLRRPELVDESDELFRMELIEHGRHALHEVAFVDAYTAHVPIYPESLTITICLWSNSAPTSWKDVAKRSPLLRRHAATLRSAAARAGLARQLDLKVDAYKDYYPSKRGFVGMKDREEFPYTSNEDYLYCMFHIIQETGNPDLAPVIEQHLQDGGLERPDLVKELLEDLRAGVPIEGRLSPEHYDVPTANFSVEDVRAALAAQH